MLVMLGCVRFPNPRLSNTANPDGLSTPMLGPFPRSELKKIPARKGLASPMQREVWESFTRAQSSGVTACCLVNRGHAPPQSGSQLKF